MVKPSEEEHKDENRYLEALRVWLSLRELGPVSRMALSPGHSSTYPHEICNLRYLNGELRIVDSYLSIYTYLHNIVVLDVLGTIFL